MDEVIPEPLGGAHSDPVAAFPHIKSAIMGTFRHYENMTEREIQLDRCGWHSLAISAMHISILLVSDNSSAGAHCLPALCAVLLFV
jgi:hypothetical protein